MSFKEEFLALCEKYPNIEVIIDDYGNKIRIIGAWDDNCQHGLDVEKELAEILMNEILYDKDWSK